MLDDLHALVEFAQAGSIAGAADRLFRTPSAITRQLQRLEAALGAELLDRSVKPPRLNSLGSKVLEQARDLLQRTEELKSVASRDAEPHGLLRIGLAHPLAEGTLIEHSAFSGFRPSHGQPSNSPLSEALPTMGESFRKLDLTKYRHQPVVASIPRFGVIERFVQDDMHYAQPDSQ